jgi:small subunit ribosomal protein S1
MTNQVNQDAEESPTIEKTAVEPNETSAAASAIAPQAAPSGQDMNIQTSDQEAGSASVSGPGIAAASTEAPQESSSTSANSSGPTEPKLQPSAPRVVMKPKVNPPAPSPPPAPVPAAAAAPPEESQVSGEIDFGAILEQFEQEQTVFHAGELVTGTIVGITDRGVLIDFGYKSEGFVPPEEFTGPDGQVHATVGETVEVVIRSIHSGEGAPQLSRQDALGRKVWDEIEAAFQSETPITGRVLDKTKGGLRVDLNGVEAFLPGSQIDSRPIRGLDTYIGQDIEAKIIKFSRRRNNIVLSRKVITDEVVNEQKAETLGKIDIGYVVDGVIKNLTEYGAFVDIGGIDGLLHVTDMSWGRIHHPGDQFNVGDHIQVKVLKLDREREKVSLGYKQLLPDPWSTVVEVYPVNSKLKGTVSSVTEYGVFVELEPGVEGLVHVSEISWSRRSQSPKRIFHKGQEVDVQVLGVDTVEKRISLGMKQFQDNPWDFVDIKYPIGAKVRGRVRNLTDFGAFVELEEGIDGLVHVSDISWAKKIKHPKDVLKKDQEVEAVVTSIDKRGQRLSLSMKDLTPSAWEGFVATHRPGDVVRGKVSRFTNFGVFVELEEGLEGLCHISELSDERIDRAESVAELGQEMDFKILRIEPVEQKIGLSHRAVGKEDEPVVDTKIYSTEAKGGMASLGELAKLRRGDSAEETEPQQDPEEKKREKAAAKQARAEEFAAREAQGQESTAEPSARENEAQESGLEERSDIAEAESSETAYQQEQASQDANAGGENTGATSTEANAASDETGDESAGDNSSAAQSEGDAEQASPEELMDTVSSGGDAIAESGAEERLTTDADVADNSSDDVNSGGSSEAEATSEAGDPSSSAGLPGDEDTENQPA